MGADDELIAEIARAWVDGGGDAEGLSWGIARLHAAVEAEITERAMKETSEDQRGW